MNYQLLDSLISQVTSLPYLEDNNTQIYQYLSILQKNKQDDQQNQIITNILKSSIQKNRNLTTNYNNLLQKIRKIIKFYEQINKQNIQQLDQKIQQLYKCIQDHQSKQNQFKYIMEQCQNTIGKLTNLLRDKQQQINLLEEEKISQDHNQSIKIKQFQSLNSQHQHLTEQFLQLSSQNHILLKQNNKIKLENIQLLSQLKILKLQLIKLQITPLSPPTATTAIIQPKQKYPQKQSQPHYFSKHIQQQQQLLSQSNQQLFQQNLSSTFSYIKPAQPLKDILNISDSNSTYFNFKTKQIISTNPKKHQFSRNSFNHFHQNLQPLMLLNQQQQYHSNHHSSLTVKLRIPLDPYYVYFMITIQCIKLNWGNMDEVMNIPLKDQWNNYKETIPYQQWHDSLKNLLKQKVKSSR